MDALVEDAGREPPREALERLAATEGLDPWLVVERLREIASARAARQFEELPGIHAEPLATYLRAAPPLPRVEGRDEAISAALEWLGRPPATPDPVAGLVDARGRTPAGSVRSVQLDVLHARCLTHRGELDAGLPALDAAAAQAATLGWLGGAKSARIAALRAAFPAGRVLAARAAAEALVGLHTQARDVEGLAATNQDLAQIEHLLGNTADAVNLITDAILTHEQLGLAAKSERARLVRMVWVATLGWFGAAADEHLQLQTALAVRGDALQQAQLQLDWANVLWLSGDYEAALGTLTPALAAFEAQGKTWERGLALGTRGNILLQAGRWQEALAAHELAYATLLEARQALSAAQAQVGIAEALILGLDDSAGDRSERARLARAAATAAHETFGKGGATARKLSSQTTLAKALTATGETAAARRLLEDTLAECEALGLQRLVLSCRLELARLLGAAQAWQDAVLQAKAGIARLLDVEGVQAQRETDRATTMRADLHDVGVRASAQLRDATALHGFLERGRTASLLTGLGGRSAALRATLPAELVQAADRAQGAKVEALRAYLVARTKIGGGADARWADYLRRRDEDGDVQRRVREREEAAMPVLAPRRLTTLVELQRRLAELRPPNVAPGEPSPATVYLALNLQADVGHALVATRDETRLVIYGTEEMVRLRAALTSLLASLVPHDEDVPPTPDAAALRAIADTLLPPLRLPEGPVRLLISPDRELAFVPFALVLPERIRPVFVPSATVLDVLMRTRFATGTGVLACGDPDYKVKDLEGRGVALRGAPRLLALRNSRAEVEAVTPDRTVDGRLLGQAFTERGLARALTDGTAGAPPGPPRRRRALLLSCHGLLDVERPALSALALTPGDGEDGYLTAVEVLRLPVHADLVVLSACQTGRGRFVRGEGVMGLARAFMHAGAPRVVVSLWNVDDEATAFLMARLHELWRTGKVGLSDALQQAQRLTREHVFERTVAPAGQPARAEKKAWWADPAYWAPWVIWGLPD